jgi:hypothetical protein
MIYSEQETRRRLLNQAFNFGGQIAVHDLQAIFAKYDKAVQKCTNDNERKHMAHCMGAEIHRYFNCQGPLVMSGKVIIPAEQGYEEENNSDKIIKL